MITNNSGLHTFICIIFLDIWRHCWRHFNRTCNYARKQLLLSVRLSHCNFICPSVCLSVRLSHAGRSVKNGAS